MSEPKWSSRRKESLAADTAPRPDRSGTLALNRKDATKDASEEQEQAVYEDALSVIEGVQMFWAVKPDEFQLTEAPRSWVKAYGSKALANKMFSLAKMGNLTKQEAPMGVHVSVEVAKAVMKKKSAEKSSGSESPLLIGNAVEMPALQDTYPTKEVFDDGD